MKHIGKGTLLFQLIPAKEFRELCDRYKIDKGVRKLAAQKQVWALVMAYILKLDSLREIESTLGIPRSTLSDANANRESKFFEELCQIVLWKIYAQLKGRKIKRAIRTLLAMDSTECRIHGSLSKLPKWKTKGSSKVKAKASAKLHLIWNVNDEWIESFKITAGRVSDSPIAKVLKIRPNCTYLFDRAYNELSFWWKIIVRESHFVSRLKKHSYNNWKYKRKLKEYEGKDGVLWEQTWKPSKPVLRLLPEIPKDLQLRQIVFKCPETKKVFNFITSDFESAPELIADMYKKRWAVELLFRWLKGHLKVRSLQPRNTNAVRILLAVAVLVQLLIQLYRLITKFKGTPWECLRELRTSWHRAALGQIIQKYGASDPFSPESTQGADLKPCYR